MRHTSFSASKWSLRSPGFSTLLTRPQSISARRFMFALPRLMFSCSITSSVLNGSVASSSSAWTWAIVRLMPQALPKAPQASMNFRRASGSCMGRR